MPELPDITIYLEALERHVTGHVLRGVRLLNPFLLRSVDPPLDSVEGRVVTGFERLGKRIVFEFEEDGKPPRFLVLHLMIAGRLRLKKPGSTPGRKVGLAAFDFDHATLVLTEASSKKRASLHVVASREELARHDPGGLAVLDASLDAFRKALTRENHTIKRALTDPRILSGIGNAYSDEILHRAKMSPYKLTDSMSDDELETLFRATGEVLQEWITRHREAVGDGFPDKVTAFHSEMAVHGKYGEPCPVCGRKVMRIRYADRESNYCPTCQTGGKLFADRSLSRLLKKDWPKTLDELEQRMDEQRGD